jgi:hypothetical protein
MRAFLSDALNRGAQLTAWRFKCLRGALCAEERWLVLGLYPEGPQCPGDGTYGGTFCGTDRLAFVAKRDLDAWLATEPSDVDALLFEGDRLFNGKTLGELKGRTGSQTLFWMLQAEPDELAERRAARPEVQSPAFLKRQATKCANVLANASLGVELVKSTDSDLVQRIQAFIKA